MHITFETAHKKEEMRLKNSDNVQIQVISLLQRFLTFSLKVKYIRKRAALTMKFFYDLKTGIFTLGRR